MVDSPGIGGGAVGLIVYLAAVRDRGSGIRPWLDLYAYTALLLFYAFGLGASAARRSTTSRCSSISWCLTPADSCTRPW